MSEKIMEIICPEYDPTLNKQNKLEEFFCGLHSNIPECCILFFLGHSDDFVYFIEDARKIQVKINGNIEKIYCFSGDNNWQIKDVLYSLCPECVVNITSQKIIPNQLRSCNCGEKNGNLMCVMQNSQVIH